MTKQRHFLWAAPLTLLLLTLLALGCEEDNHQILFSLRAPGAMLQVERCVIENAFEPMEVCEENNVQPHKALFVANLTNGTVSYAGFRGSDFEIVDIDRAVPGVSSVVTGDRPQAMATDALSRFLLVTSPINNDLSIISLQEFREVAYLSMDKPARRIHFDAERNRFLFFMQDGNVRSLVLTYDCSNPLDAHCCATCPVDKERIALAWKDLNNLSGAVHSIVKHPEKPIMYVSFSNRRYISAVGLDEDAGVCLEGGSYPCEVQRLGAGFSCADGIDNDGDGLIDSQDPQCFYPWSTETTDGAGLLGPGPCNDGLDNDGDGLFDAYDPKCHSMNDASETDADDDVVTLGSCGDGVDNDGDGLIDRDDPHCLHAIDDETIEKAPALYTPVCNDGRDNDGDGLTDTQDPGCYGKKGWTESYDKTLVGRGELSIDKAGRWLFVLDQGESQVIIIDLEKGETVNLWGRFPRHDVVGLPVNRIPLAAHSVDRTEVLYEKDHHRVEQQRTVLYVSSSSGSVQAFIIDEKLVYTHNGEVVETLYDFTPRAYDLDKAESYFGIVRCLDILCADRDLPILDFRKRLLPGFFTDTLSLGYEHPTTGAYNLGILDFNIFSETWRLAYEGALETSTRHDGYIPTDGEFLSGNDFCLLGARPGDRLLFTNHDAVQSGAECAVFQDNSKALEWEVTEVRAKGFSLKVVDEPSMVTALPTKACFKNGIHFEVRASKQWLLTGSKTAINRRAQIGEHCVDTDLYRYGTTRFAYQDDKPAGAPDAQTAFFSVTLPSFAKQVKRGFTYEFTTRSGQNSLLIPTGAATTDIQSFEYNGKQYLLISDASQHSVYYYDIERDAILQEL